jgi:cell division protease FtsH
MAFALYGSLERGARLTDGETARRTAVHESGHVLVRYLSDPFGTIPEYCGIMEWDNMLGVTVDCYSSRVNSFHKKAWQDMIANIRVTLGGRAAEHLVFGVRGLSAAGSRSDLEGVTSMVRAMIEDFGLPLRDGTFDEALDHLMVSSGVLSPSESTYNEFRIREFMRREYVECFRLLEGHRALLLRLAEEIRSRVILDQQELRQILETTPPEGQDTGRLPYAA